MPKQRRQELDFFKLVKRGLVSGFAVMALFLIVLLFFTPTLSSLLIGSVNRFFLTPTALHLSARITGAIIPNGVELQNIQLIDAYRNVEMLRAEELNIRLHWSSIFKKNMVLSRIALENTRIDTGLWNWHSPQSDSKRKINLIVHRLSMDNITVRLPESSTMDSITINRYQGSGWYLDGILYAATDSAEIDIGDPLNQPVQFSGGVSLEGGLSGQLIDFGIQMAQGAGIFNAQWKADSLGGNVTLPQLDLAKLLESQQLQVPVDTLQLFNFDIDVLSQGGNWIASGGGETKINDHNPRLQLNRVSWDSLGLRADAILNDGTQNLEVSGRLQSDGNLDLMGNFINLDFSNDFPSFPAQQVSGDFKVSGDKKFQKAQLRLQRFTIGAYHIDDLTLLAIRDSKNQFMIDSLGVDLGHSRASLSGVATPDTLMLTGKAEIDNIADMLMYNDEKLSPGGQVDLTFNLSGSPLQPKISGSFQQRNFGLLTTVAVNGVGKFSLTKHQDNWSGELVLQAGSGQFLGDSLKSLNLTASLQNSQISLSNFNLRTGRYIIASSGLVSPDSIRINRLNVLVGDLAISLAEPLRMDLAGAGESYWDVPRSVFTVNRGGVAVEGRIKESGELDLKLNAELISIATINRAFKMTIPASGELSGSFSVQGQLANPIVDATFSWTKPTLGKMVADNFSFSGVLENRELNISKAELTRGEKSIYLVGTVPVGYTSEQWQAARYEPQIISVKFTRYPLKELRVTEFRGTPIAGVVSGTMNIRGSAGETIMDGNLTLADGRWDKLEFNRGSAIFNYQRGVISLDSVSISANWGLASGLGYLSGRLDLRPEVRERPAVNPMDLTFKGNFTNLKMLPTYIAGFDELTGDFSVDMHLYGSYENPIRDMKIRGHHATLAVGVLDNKITDIHTEMTMQNNLMTIDHFSGKMRYEQGTALQRGGIVSSVTDLFGSLIGVQTARQYTGDIFMTGMADFSSFFNPRFNIRLKGDQIYYRNLTGGIEAIADLDMTIEGQDTLRINAEMPILNALYYNNFSTQKTYDVRQTAPSSQSSTRMLTYNLHTVFQGNLRIDNDFISAEMDGELWLLDYGDGQLRFSGTLEAEPGGKFFYLGNVLTIESGTLTFDPIEFNPTISDFVVSTYIEGKRIYLVVSGDLKEPQLSLEASQTTTHTMDDILTYLTINQKVTEGISLAPSSIGDPVRSYVGLLVSKTGERLLSRSVGLDYLDIQSPYLGTATGDTTRILMGQQISRDLKMTYQTDFNRVDPNLGYKFGVEYRVNKNVSIIGNVNQDGLVELRSRVRYSY